MPVKHFAFAQFLCSYVIAFNLFFFCFHSDSTIRMKTTDSWLQLTSTKLENTNLIRKKY